MVLQPHRAARERFAAVAAAAFFVVSFAFASFAAADSSPGVGPPFASFYDKREPFLTALAAERQPPAPSLHVTGIAVPHHVLAADLIARGFRAASGGQYDRIIIVSPDHFRRSRRPLNTSTPLIRATVHGTVGP